jgi:hypothetical protein
MIFPKTPDETPAEWTFQVSTTEPLTSLLEAEDEKIEAQDEAAIQPQNPFLNPPLNPFLVQN